MKTRKLITALTLTVTALAAGTSLADNPGTAFHPVADADILDTAWRGASDSNRAVEIGFHPVADADILGMESGTAEASARPVEITFHPVADADLGVPGESRQCKAETAVAVR